MVHFEEGGAVTAKIIDLGLAKSLDEPGAQTAISTPGVFAGTPEFASPEQFAGLALDTRSDLYSLGVTLWEMLTGTTPFRGTPGEVMYQHQHAPLPLERLKDVPQPVVVLLEELLEKDPAQRFRTPNELLKVIPTITGAIDVGRRIARKNLKQIPNRTSHIGTAKPPARLAPNKISLARLPVTGSEIFGREEDLTFLDLAWVKKEVNVVTFTAFREQSCSIQSVTAARCMFGCPGLQEALFGSCSSADGVKIGSAFRVCNNKIPAEIKGSKPFQIVSNRYERLPTRFSSG